MKHATLAALAQIEELLNEVRSVPSLIEKKTGVFYRRSKPLVHFHEDAAGMFADVSRPDAWVRMPVNSPAEIELFLAVVWELSL